MSKIIISCAITGSIHTPSMSPYLPVTAEEIAARAIGAEQGQRGRGLQRLGSPERIAAGQAKGGEGIGLGQPFQRVGTHTRPAPEAFDIGIAIAAGGGDPGGILFAHALDLPEAQPQRQGAIRTRLQSAIPD